MKRIKNILTISIISIIALLSIEVKSLASTTAKVTVETANLRKEASANSKILEQLSLDDNVEVIEQNGEWYKVKYKSIEGYLRGDLIKIEGEVQNSENQNSSEDSTQEQPSTEVSTTPEENALEKNEDAQTNQIQDDEKKLGSYKTKEDISLKIIPLIQAKDVDTANANQTVKVIDIKNNWACVEFNGKQGWIILDKIEYIEQEENKVDEQVEENTVVTSEANEPKEENTTEEEKQPTTVVTKKTQYVSASAVNLRKSASTSSEVLASLTQNTEVTVLEEANGWSKVEVNGKQGYISTQLLSDKRQETSRGADTVRKPAESNNNTNQTNNSVSETNTSTNKGQEVVAYAKQYLGYKYVYGGTTTSGFDCSGFTQYVYKHFGVSLNRTAAAQYSNGTSVTNLQTGDLVMFGKSGINHVGIYISGGTFIHAANPSRGVTTDTLLSGYYKTNYVGARRIFN